MKGRPILFDSENAVESAQKLFWEKGYTASSLSDLLTATGMGSGSFYNTFKGGKKELFKKVLLQRRAALNEFKDELDRNESPIELIKDFFRSVAAADMSRHLKGCIIANTIAEMTFLEQDLLEEAVTIMKDTETMYTAAIKKGQEDGLIKNQTDPTVLGRYLITLWSGLNILRRIYPEPEILLEQIELQLKVVS